MGKMKRATNPVKCPSNCLIDFFRIIFLSSMLILFSCSQDPKYADESFEFLEVGQPLIGEPILDPKNTVSSDIVEVVEQNATDNGQSTIIEGEIILGKTLLGSEGNQSLPIVNNLPPHDPSGGYEMITYSMLTEFPYEIDWESDGLAFDFSAYASRVPRNVRNLSGKKVAIEGFMVPTVVNEQNIVEEFLLMPDQLSCCFGQAPEANGWLVVRSERGVDVAMDRVVRVLGNLTVEERWDQEFFVGLYHVECDEMIHQDQ